MLGHFLYMCDRNSIFKTFMESDRCLKEGGFLVIGDFDTPVRLSRENKHDASIPTYKDDYSKYLLPYGYTLVEKKMYSKDSDCFVADVQERVSTQIFYKENAMDLFPLIL